MLFFLRNIVIVLFFDTKTLEILDFAVHLTDIVKVF